jgi:tripartite-type tricarboxylate transporter receptor subunit TctC
VPDYEKVASGVDIYGPARLPPVIAKRIYTEIDRAAALPDVRQRMKEISFPYDGTALGDMTAIRTREVDTVTRALKAAGLEPH